MRFRYTSFTALSLEHARHFFITAHQDLCIVAVASVQFQVSARQIQAQYLNPSSFISLESVRPWTWHKLRQLPLKSRSFISEVQLSMSEASRAS